MHTIKILATNRFVVFGAFSIILVIANIVFTGSALPSPGTEDLWFYSGIFMVLFSLLFIEPYYTSPKNVITNAIPLLLVMLSIGSSFTNPLFWWLAIIVLVLLIIISTIALALDDQTKSPDSMGNRVSVVLKEVAVHLGQGKLLYSAMFVYFLIAYHSIQNLHTLVMFVLWLAIISINPKKIHTHFDLLANHKTSEQIGEIFGVQSKKIFLVKLYEDRRAVNRFDIVKFNYSMQDSDGIIILGIVFDTYLLNQEKWAKILQLSGTKDTARKMDKNVVYKLTDPAEIASTGKDLRVDRLVGTVIENSNIGKIRFEYSKKKDNLQEGDLLELNVGERRLFYQVVAGFTSKEKLEARNETGFIEGEALQLGEWRSEDLSFQKFGWVPSINTPVFMADTSNVAVKEFGYPEYKLGVIPGTSLPSVINLDEAVSHHMALLGVTGSGKSYLAREIIKQISINMKVICVDFNKEFANELTPAPINIISDEAVKVISDKIDWINNELEKFGNQQNKPLIATKQSEIKEALKAEIISFLDNNTDNIRIFELPDVSNTTGILDYTKHFFKVLFEIAKEKQVAGTPSKICVVLEEAHTIIPEWNFSGSSDKTSQSLVNSIGQITLQGRKYGVGFLVIAQRTANVSKTVLTQCNTVVCFQAFDETSFTFLGNYVGKDMVQALPNMKRYHAVAAGKAVKSNTPMIIDLTRE